MRNNIFMSGIRQTKYNAHTFIPCCIYIFRGALLKLLPTCKSLATTLTGLAQSVIYGLSEETELKHINLDLIGLKQWNIPWPNAPAKVRPTTY